MPGKINIQSSDGENFKVDLDVAKMSITIRTMLEDLGVEKEEDKDVDEVLPLPSIGQSMIFDLIIAANYLHIKGLMGIGTMEVARMMKDKSPEEIRKLFNLPNDLMDEDEQMEES